MNHVLLFDEKIRTLEGPADYNADMYSFYNDSAKPGMNNIRDLLEEWFAQYPEDEKPELKSRFKVAFHPAFYELYVYILFNKLGHSLTIDPLLPNTKKRPDYLAKKGENKIFIEVKYVTMLSQNRQSHERMKNTLLDALNRVESSNFFLKLDNLLFKSERQPSGKLIIRYFNDLLGKYDVNRCNELLNRHGFSSLPHIGYEDDHVRIEATLLPGNASNKTKKMRALAMLPCESKIGDDSDNIIRALETKAMRYGTLNAPYVRIT